MLERTRVEKRSNALASGVMLMQAFEEQFLAFLSCLQQFAERNRDSVRFTDGEYERGFKSGVTNGLQMVLDDLLMFYGDFKRIQEKISVAVASEPRQQV
ncbi:hypothetical protein [Alicyclobacillus contaminans]|uniref:hypothetical protein n=1 Tax=Alicyclobacillus contaminans TaxID=392016 RepID=UPI00047EDBAB|nr:hypothetical protein [Alicyclobacillus contaminans]